MPGDEHLKRKWLLWWFPSHSLDDTLGLTGAPPDVTNSLSPGRSAGLTEALG